jgi:hypothetical protein
MVGADGFLKGGKYSGLKASDVPPDYLRFLYWQCDFGDEVDARIMAEIKRRGVAPTDKNNNQQSCDAARARRDAERRNYSNGQSGNSSASLRSSKPINKEMLSEIISAGRQALAKRNHPDVGGDAEKMKLINITADLAIEMVAKL